MNRFANLAWWAVGGALWVAVILLTTLRIGAEFGAPHGLARSAIAAGRVLFFAGWIGGVTTWLYVIAHLIKRALQGRPRGNNRTEAAFFVAFWALALIGWLVMWATPRITPGLVHP